MVLVSGRVLLVLVSGIPVGRLADKIGRKRVIYLLTPLWYASNFLLVLSPAFTLKVPVMLVLSSILLAFYNLSSGVTNAMTLEVIALEQQGRWGGLLGFFAGLVTIPAPLLGGLIWRELGPGYVFLIPIGLDLLLRIPLLATVPETLKTKADR